MTHIIYKTLLNLPDDQLAAAVDSHIRELVQWTENMRLYDEEQKSTPAPEEPQRADFETDEAFSEAYIGWTEARAMRRHPYPPPSAHPEIDKAVVRNEDGTFTADYRVTDDLPPVVVTSELQKLKDTYINRVAHAESEALAKLIPPGKVRLMNLRVTDIRSEDNKRETELLTEIAKRADIAKKAGKEPEPVVVDLQNLHEQHRPPEDTVFLKQAEEIATRQTAIVRKAAEMTHDIEDLTEDNVHDWVLGSLE